MVAVGAAGEASISIWCSAEVVWMVTIPWCFSDFVLLSCLDAEALADGASFPWALNEEPHCADIVSAAFVTDLMDR